jgi:hypothetical protein
LVWLQFVVGLQCGLCLTARSRPTWTGSGIPPAQSDNICVPLQVLKIFLKKKIYISGKMHLLNIHELTKAQPGRNQNVLADSSDGDLS